jgi:hypothetical protein
MMGNKWPKVTFGVIVLNGEPFTRYCLRALYPFAHEIIVVEGANKYSASIATPEGHSIDCTLDTLFDFKAKEDPEDKVKIVTKDGFWIEKDEQSQAYANLATGDYLWQVDIDEFYQSNDMITVLNMLKSDPEIAAVSFKQISFWGGFDYITDGWFLLKGAKIFHRLFKWGEGYQYITHRPPTVHDSSGRNLHSLKWIRGEQLSRQGILLYHYSLVFPKQVLDKCRYYQMAGHAPHSRTACAWADNNFFKLNNPYRVHNVHSYPSWLKRFEGVHPSSIQQLEKDIKLGIVKVETRDNGDVERLLNSSSYKIGSAIYSMTWRIAQLQDIISMARGCINHRLGFLYK